MDSKASLSVGGFFASPVNSWLAWSMLFTMSLSSRFAKLKRSEESESVPSVPAASLMMPLLVAPAVPSFVSFFCCWSVERWCWHLLFRKKLKMLFDLFFIWSWRHQQKEWKKERRLTTVLSIESNIKQLSFQLFEALFLWLSLKSPCFCCSEALCFAVWVVVVPWYLLFVVDICCVIKQITLRIHNNSTFFSPYSFLIKAWKSVFRKTVLRHSKQDQPVSEIPPFMHIIRKNMEINK